MTVKASRTGLPIAWMAAAMCAIVAVLTVWGYRANQESQRANQVLADRRAAEAAALVARAFSRDMRGAHASVLLSAEWSVDMLAPPFDIQAIISRAFTDYPYPESFFAWMGEPSFETMRFFDRADRRPPSRPRMERATFPVEIASAPAFATEIARRIAANRTADGMSSIFEMEFEGVPYQVVTRLVYEDDFQERLAAGFGFTVNLEWARATYFPEQVDEMRSAAGIGDDLTLTIRDENGRPVAGQPPASTTAPLIRHDFPMVFADPLRIGFRSPPELPTRNWSIEVGSEQAPVLLGLVAFRERGTFILMAATAVALALGLASAARAARATAQMAELRSDFVATLTHELKTPIASIRALGDSIRSGRASDAEEVREYAGLVVEESRQLARLVDNALAYARVTDATEVYHFEPVSLHELIDEALARFAARLQVGGFSVTRQIPDALPLVRADRAALRLLLDNLVDNAIRYSDERRCLTIATAIDGDKVNLSVADAGIGMSEEDVRNLGRKFFRGTGGLGRSGSGLGLAIVGRIAKAHGSTLDVASRVGQGTTVRIALPIAR
jgi:signal transduction histidine kinase